MASASPSLRYLAKTQSPPPPPEIHVCHASTCRSHGAEAVLAEIEELASTVGGGCTVAASGCLGYCRRAPAALVIRESAVSDPSDPNPPREQRYHPRIHSLEASATVVRDATGKTPATTIATERFAALRLSRSRQHARSLFHWNSALKGLAGLVSTQAALPPQPGSPGVPGALANELGELLASAGFPAGVPGGPVGMPDAIESYSQWTLESMTPVSKHSILYCFVSKDRARGTPHPRGRGKLPEPNTWHTTLLAEVGANDEGPLPWIERDYTPISTAKQWEQGKVEILIKIYSDGAATQWCRQWLRTAPPTQVWLSTPVRTLHVPGLVPEGGGGFQPGSVLLLLAGTGAVALPQVLHHRDPLYKLGMSTSASKQLRVPIDVVLSFRDDDVLCIPQIADLCRDKKAGVRHCTLLLTAANAAPPIFPGASGGDGAAAESALQDVENATIVRSRLNAGIVSSALDRMEAPCRVVVSGPDSFNSAARELLKGVISNDNVTILSA